MRTRRLMCLMLALSIALSAGTAMAQIASPAQLTINTNGSQVTLNWPAVPGASSYNIYKDTNPDVSLSFPYDVAATNSYTDNANGVKYFYAVTAVVPTGCFSGVVYDSSYTVDSLLSLRGPVGDVNLYGENQSNPSFSFCIQTLSDGSYNVCDIVAGTYNIYIHLGAHPVLTDVITVTDGGFVVRNYTWQPFTPVVVSGHITSNTTWTRNNVYQLNGSVMVDSLNTLTIESGTSIIGNFPLLGTLVISRGADIYAVGSACLPIVMTSNRAKGYRANGDWGGLVINGNAHNNRGEVPNGEGDSGPFGRSDTTYDHESSGTVRYVRIEFGGFRFTETNELNSLCLQSVGRGTDISYVQIIAGQDDAVEFFGGTAGVHHVVICDCGDDGFDWTDGWQGVAHHVLIHQNSNTSDCGIEADNLEQNHNALPRSHATLSNFTIIGKKGNSATDGDRTMRMRRGTEFQIFNTILTLAKRRGFFIEDAATSQNGAIAPGVPDRNKLDFSNSLFWNNGTIETIDPSTGAGIGDGHFHVPDGYWDLVNCQPHANYPVVATHVAAPTGWTQDATDFRGCGFVGSNATNRIANPGLVNPAGYPVFDAHPTAGSPAFTGGAASLPAGLPVVPYVGCYSSPTDNWTQGWTRLYSN